MRSLADVVLFEFGPSRRRDLAFRDRLRRWQPQLRTLFLMRVASLKYRLQLPGFELPEGLRIYQQEYDERSARVLEGIADGLEGTAPKPGPAPDFLKVLQQVRQAERVPGMAAARAESFFTLLRNIDGLTSSLADEIARESETR